MGDSRLASTQRHKNKEFSWLGDILSTFYLEFQQFGGSYHRLLKKELFSMD